MSLKKTTIAALLAASGLVVSSASMAQGKPADTGFYAGATIGQSDFSSADCSGVTCDTKDTAFRILAGFAPCEVWNSYPLLLAGEAALRLPGAAEHPGYPLALAASAVFASNRGDVTGAEELCHRAGQP